MRQVCKTVYKFDELSEGAKEKAREWWRNATADDPLWYECTTDDAKECLKFAGFRIDNVYFSGFWLQGDGACFEGAWSAKDVNAVGMAEHAPQDQEANRIAGALQGIADEFPLASISVKHRGHYHHELCTQFSGADFPDDPIEDMDYGSPEYTARNERLQAVEARLIELARDAMRWIYKRLESEWEYQNSDEQVDETIRANEYEFTESGAIYY